MKTLLTYLCALVALTACEGLFATDAMGQNYRQMSNAISYMGDSTLKYYQDETQKLHFRLFTSNKDTVGIAIKTPHEMETRNFISDHKGLSNHLERCCYGHIYKPTFSVTKSTTPEPGELMEFIVRPLFIPACRFISSYSCYGKIFAFDPLRKTIMYLREFEKIHTRFQPISSITRYKFWSEGSGLYELAVQKRPIYDVTIFPTKSQRLDLVTIKDLFDMTGIEQHDCCTYPTLDMRIVALEIDSSRVVENKIDAAGLPTKFDTTDTLLKGFTIRYFPKKFPHPPCHDKYRKVFYIDLIYDPTTCTFSNLEVPFEPEKHKNVDVPLD